jgi:hypothetical protein
VTQFYCQAYEADGRRIGGFVVEASTMSEALTKAGKNIEVAIRPEQHEIRVARFDGARNERAIDGPAGPRQS